MLGTTIFQCGVPKEWLNRSNNIKRPLQAKMVMAKVEAIKRTKNRRAELVQVYKEEKEWDTLPNDDDTVNEEDDDKGYEPENCGEPWKNYKGEKYFTNK